MKIILSPAKKMITDTDSIAPDGLPEFIDKTLEIQSWLNCKSKEELKTIWKCNEKIAELNFNRLQNMDIYHMLTPAVLSYEGIDFQYMAPSVFENSQFEYVQNHLRILSAFYGILKPMDGVTPYRLEMQAKVEIGDVKNLYEYWHDMLYRSVIDESRIIINLASKEYSKCIEKYLTPKDKYITISFCEQAGNKLVTKGTYAKMARGEMVRFMAAHFISSFWFEILPVIHLTMVKADLDHPALEKIPFYEARLIHRKDIHMASVHSAGQFQRYYKQPRWHLRHGCSWQTANSGGLLQNF